MNSKLFFFYLNISKLLTEIGRTSLLPYTRNWSREENYFIKKDEKEKKEKKIKTHLLNLIIA